MTGIIGGISLANFVQLLLPIPPLEEQKRIVAKVDELMAHCDKLEAQQQQQANTLLRANTSAINAFLNPENTNITFDENWQRITKHFNTLYGSALPMPETTGRKKKYLVSLHNIKEMKQVILQLAISGKLTPQSHHDEHANILLSRIAKMKDKLISDGIIKKRKIDIKTIGGQFTTLLPTGWSRCNTHDVSLLITDGTHKTPNYTESGVRFVSAKDVSSSRLVFNSCKYISNDEHTELIKRCKPEFGDILVSKSGSIGTVVLIEDKGKFSLFESLALIKVPHEFINKGYFRLSLQAECHKLTDSHIRGVAVKHLHLNVLRGLNFNLPPLEEQKRIVANVDQLMKHCDQLEQQLTQSYSQAEKLMEATVKALVA